jgi:endonuclease/exonuclease/phosphatase family metal-dependent hydrolase
VPVVRVLTYNVRSMRDDAAAVARIISSAEPDVVCIQEAPRFLRWRSKCAAIARRSGLVVVTGGRTAAGNLVLSSLAVDVDSSVDLLFGREPLLHRRGCALAVLRRGGSRFAVAGTHLDLKPEPRLRHVAELHAAIAAHVPHDVPVVVAGDMNDRPGSPTWTAVGAGRVDVVAEAARGPVFTSTARDPHQTIDGIFVDPRFGIRSAEVVRHPDAAIASDHLPVLAELELP